MTMKGFTSEQKIGDQNYATLQPAGSGKYASDVFPKAIATTSAAQVPEATSTKKEIHLAGHIAKEGDIIRFTAGVNIYQEVSVIKADANIIYLGHQFGVAITAVDVFDIATPVTLTINTDGGLAISQGPVEFLRDGVVQQATEDTADITNNRPVPQGLMIKNEAGDWVPVTLDQTSPYNHTPIPVAITDVTGSAVVNVTAGDLNVSIKHDGADPSSVRLGDGTNLAQVNAALQLEVHDTLGLAEQTAIKTAVEKVGQVASAASFPVVLSTEQEVILSAIQTANEVVGQLANVASAPVTLSTEQQAILSAIQTATSERGQEASATSIPVTLSTEQEVIQNAIKTAVEKVGQLANATSAPVTLSTEQEVILDAIKTAVEAAPAVTYLAPVDFLDTGLVDTSSTNIIPGGLTVVASLAADCKEIEIFEDIGEFMVLTDAADTILAYLPLGGGRVKVSISATTGLKLASVSGTISLGKIAINFLG